MELFISEIKTVYQEPTANLEQEPLSLLIKNPQAELGSSRLSLVIPCFPEELVIPIALGEQIFISKISYQLEDQGTQVKVLSQTFLGDQMCSGQFDDFSVDPSLVWVPVTMSIQVKLASDTAPSGGLIVIGIADFGGGGTKQ